MMIMMMIMMIMMRHLVDIWTTLEWHLKPELSRAKPELNRVKPELKQKPFHICFWIAFLIENARQRFRWGAFLKLFFWSEVKAFGSLFYWKRASTISLTRAFEAKAIWSKTCVNAFVDAHFWSKSHPMYAFECFLDWKRASTISLTRVFEAKAIQYMHRGSGFTSKMQCFANVLES